MQRSSIFQIGQAPSKRAAKVGSWLSPPSVCNGSDHDGARPLQPSLSAVQQMCHQPHEKQHLTGAQDFQILSYGLNEIDPWNINSYTDLAEYFPEEEKRHKWVSSTSGCRWYPSSRSHNWGIVADPQWLNFRLSHQSTHGWIAPSVLFFSWTGAVGISFVQPKPS